MCAKMHKKMVSVIYFIFRLWFNQNVVTFIINSHYPFAWKVPFNTWDPVN